MLLQYQNFVGEPQDDPEHQDYVPTVMPLCYRKQVTEQEQEQLECRHQRALKRRAKAVAMEEQKELEEEQKELEEEESKRSRLEAANSLIEFSKQEYICNASTQTTPVSTTDQSVQTSSQHVQYDSEQQQQSTIHQLQLSSSSSKTTATSSSAFRATMIQGNDALTRVYTGLPSWPVFFHLVMFLTPFAKPNLSFSLMIEDEIFLTLVRLRLALIYEDLAHRFDISVASVSRIFQKWVDIMFAKLRFLIAWPQRDIIRQNMPPLFKSLYPKCCCIIDCSEIFINIPSSYSARSKTYSDYKKHNTIKFLIGVTPCGSICFLSQCWGGRVSDKNLTQQSGFFRKLDRGDVVLADRGFTLTEDFAVHGARLELPAFSRGKTQLTQCEVEKSKQLSMVRIHVERVIGLLKNKFTILKGPLPVDVLKHKHDIEVANIDKLLVVCSALTNLNKSVVC